MDDLEKMINFCATRQLPGGSAASVLVDAHRVSNERSSPWFRSLRCSAKGVVRMKMFGSKRFASVLTSKEYWQMLKPSPLYALLLYFHFLQTSLRHNRNPPFRCLLNPSKGEKQKAMKDLVEQLRDESC